MPHLESSNAIAVAALVVSLAVGTWQVLEYVLVAGRVRVRMQPAAIGEYSLRQAITWGQLGPRLESEGGWYLEGAVVRVENVGRYAVTISDVSLDLGRWKPFRSGRVSLSPRQLDAFGGRTEESVRLEPFDQARFVFDVWGALAHVAASRPSRHGAETLTLPRPVRASVRIAGRRPKRSPWRRRWSVRAGQVSFLGDQVGIDMAAYQAFTRNHSKSGWGPGPSWEDTGGLSIIGAAIAVGKTFPATGPAPTVDEIKHVVEANTYEQLAGDNDNRANFIPARWSVAQDLERHFSGKSDEPGPDA